MKNSKIWAVTTFLSLSLFMPSARAADSAFQVDGWAQNLKSAFKSNNVAEINRLLDFNAIDRSVFQRQDTPDRQALNKARDLFAEEKFTAAIAEYNKVPKGSDFWLEAVEEKAWAYYRANESEKTLAETKTLVAPVFNSLVGTEPYFLRSLAQLKICDYKGVLETQNDFKKTQRERIKDIQDLAEKGISPEASKVVHSANSFPMTLAEAGPEARLLPLLFYRDRTFQEAAMRLKMVELGTPVLQKVISDNNPHKDLAEKALARLQLNAKNAQKFIGTRLQLLAQRETNENFKLLQKMNLVEIETVERVHADQDLDKKSYKPGPGLHADDDDLVFEDDGHPWIDELDKYQVQVTSCPSNVRRKM